MKATEANEIIAGEIGDVGLTVVEKCGTLYLRDAGQDVDLDPSELNYITLRGIAWRWFKATQ